MKSSGPTLWEKAARVEQLGYDLNMSRARAEKAKWHPLVSEVLSMLVRPEGGPSVDEQISFSLWLTSLPARERELATHQLGLIVQRLRDANEQETARVLQGIALFAAQQDSMSHAAARVRHRLESS